VLGVLKENTKGIVLLRGFEGVGDGSPVARRRSRRRCRGKDGMERSGVEGRGSVDIYVGVVRRNEEDVVVVNADTNVVRDAEAYKEWQGNVGENIYRRNNFKK
jgi:hypothetical protein